MCCSHCSFPNMDSDEFEDEEEKAEFYRVAGLIARDMYGPGGSMGNGNSSSRKANKGARSGCKQSQSPGRNTAATGTVAAAAVGEPVPGWEATEQFTISGQQLFAGKCSSCGEQCTVPFRPVQGRAPPCCRSCHNSSKHKGSLRRS